MLGGFAPFPPLADFDELLANLDRQGALYEQLLALSDREREAIGAANLTRLAEIVAEKEQMITEARALEGRREQACAQWARQMGLAESPKVDDLRRWASPDQASRLDAAALKLSQRVRRLRRANDLNAQLIEQVQRLGDHLLTAALRFAHHPIYTPQGDAATDERPSLLLDYRV